MKSRRFATLFWYSALTLFVGCVASAQQAHIPIKKEHAKPTPLPPVGSLPPLDTTPATYPPFEVPPPSVAQLPPQMVTPPDSDKWCDHGVCGFVLLPFLVAIEESNSGRTKHAPISFTPPGRTPFSPWTSGPGFFPGAPVPRQPTIPGYPAIPTNPVDSQTFQPGYPSSPSGPGAPSGPGDAPGTPTSPPTNPTNPGGPTPPPVIATPDAPTNVMLATGMLFLGLVWWRRERRAVS